MHDAISSFLEGNVVFLNLPQCYIIVVLVEGSILWFYHGCWRKRRVCMSQYLMYLVTRTPSLLVMKWREIHRAAAAIFVR